MGSDRDWERWGTSSPYFGVLTDKRFQRMDADAESEFFDSGERHISGVFAAIERREGGRFQPGKAVDVGCGVGRLALPLAKRSMSVTAVDISPSMLAEAARNRDERGLPNLEFALADDSLSRVAPGADLIHSYLVLQHIKPRRGRVMLVAMADRVAAGGYLAVQFYVACNAPLLLRGLVRLRYAFPPLNWSRNLFRSRPMFEQPMQLHVYPLHWVLGMLRLRGFSEVELHLDAEDGGNFESVFLLAKKSGCSARIFNPYAQDGLPAVASDHEVA